MHVHFSAAGAMLNLIVAACEGLGIGANGSLPWRLPREMKRFARLTKATTEPGKRNVAVMGRKTWESIPEKFRPLAGRLNVVLSRQADYVAGYDNVLVCQSLKEAMVALADRKDELETLWLIGGASLYAEAVEAGLCHRIYLTQIHAKFDECDTFLPASIDFEADFDDVTDEAVGEEERGLQREGELTYTYRVFQKKKDKAIEH